jgi:hypothetical protein
MLKKFQNSTKFQEGTFYDGRKMDVSAKREEGGQQTDN